MQIKKSFIFCLLVSCFFSKSQCPWNFTVTSFNGNFSITCYPPALFLTAANNNSNTVNYLWTGPAFSSTSVNVSLTQPGNYTITVTDAITSCSLGQIIPVGMDTVRPQLSVSLLTQTLTCYNPTILATGSSTTPNSSIGWPAFLPLLVIYPNSVIIGPPTGPPTSTASLTYANYTVVATNTINGCQTTSIVVISQNFMPPAWPVVTPTVIPPGYLCNGTASLAMVYTIACGECIIPYIWQGPTPQASLSGAIPWIPPYIAKVPGIYSVTILSPASGCGKTYTVNVPNGDPAFWLQGTAPSSSTSCNGSVVINPISPGAYTTSVSMGTLTGNNITNLCYGNLIVCLTNTATGCKKCDSILINAATSIKTNNLDEEFILYPNPTNTTFYIKNTSQKSGTIKIINIEEKEIENLIIEANKETAVQNLKAGIYFVEIRIEDSVTRKKVVVLR